MDNQIEFIEGAIAPDRLSQLTESVTKQHDIGAQDFFLGQIRADIIKGQTVKAIEFSSYTTMAEKQLNAIIREITEKYPDLKKIHILHSLGTVQTGELCMVIFVASGHRDTSFKACREITERLKKEVPIFGKEILSDATHTWKENKF